MVVPKAEWRVENGAWTRECRIIVPRMGDLPNIRKLVRVAGRAPKTYFGCVCAMCKGQSGKCKSFVRGSDLKFENGGVCIRRACECGSQEELRRQSVRMSWKTSNRASKQSKSVFVVY